MDTSLFFNAETYDIFIKLLIALVLGMIIGLERVWAHKTAGMRTYALVSMGSALFIVVSEALAANYLNFGGLDPARIASQIIVGVGFIGTGLIFTKDSKLMGLTTATGLWVAAGIGMAAGFGFTNIAVSATILTLFIFVVLWFIENEIKKIKFFKDNKPDDIY
jgi:putative Mg2+ transporter-C (MgtC) family protein